MQLTTCLEPVQVAQNLNILCDPGARVACDPSIPHALKKMERPSIMEGLKGVFAGPEVQEARNAEFLDVVRLTLESMDAHMEANPPVWIFDHEVQGALFKGSNKKPCSYGVAVKLTQRKIYTEGGLNHGHPRFDEFSDLFNRVVAKSHTLTSALTSKQFEEQFRRGGVLLMDRHNRMFVDDYDLKCRTGYPLCRQE